MTTQERFVVVWDAPGAAEPYAIIDTHGKTQEERFYDTAETEEQAQELAADYNAAVDEREQ